MTRQHTRNKEEIAARSNSAIDESRQALFDLSKDIHSHPELNYQEHYSSSALAGFLESREIRVERGVGGLETAFRATIPGGAGEGPTIAVLAEYDALPEIGHGCAHNLIAMAAMGAALGLQANAEDLPGAAMVIGTPAEEGGGGNTNSVYLRHKRGGMNITVSGQAKESKRHSFPCGGMMQDKRRCHVIQRQHQGSGDCGKSLSVHSDPRQSSKRYGELVCALFCVGVEHAVRRIAHRITQDRRLYG